MASPLTLFLVRSAARQHEALNKNTELTVTVNVSDGTYTIDVDGPAWFSSGPTAVHVNGKWSTTEDGSLKLINHKTSGGTGVWGPYLETVLTWEAEGNIPYLTVFKEYEEVPVLTFSQAFPKGVPNTSVSDASLMSSFPTIKGHDKSRERGVLTWFGGS